MLKKKLKNKIDYYVVFITGIFFLLIILLYLLVKGSYGILEEYAYYRGVADWILIAGTIMLGTFLYRINSVDKYKKYILIIIVCFGFLIRIMYAFSIESKPVSDFAVMYNTASDLLNGDYSNFWGSGYIARFPHITIPTIYFALIRLLASSPLVVIKLINVISSTIDIILIYFIVNNLFSSRKKAQVAAFSAAIYPPLILYTAVYTTENLAIPCFLLSIYLFIKFINGEHRISLLFSASLILSVGNLLRMVGNVVLAAFILYIWISYKEKFKKKVLYSLSLVIVFLIPLLTVSFSVHNAGIIENQLWKGCEPALTNILKGLNIEHGGRWNLEDEAVAEECNYNYDLIESVCKDKIKQRLFSTSKSELLAFFKEKYISQWSIGDFSGSYWAEYGVDDDDMALKFSKNGIWFSQLFLFILLVLSNISVFNIGRLKESRAISLIYYIFCGYGILYLISENQARYAFIVCWIFIIMAVVGLDLFEKIFKGKDK